MNGGVLFFSFEEFRCVLELFPFFRFDSATRLYLEEVLSFYKHFLATLCNEGRARDH